MALESLADAVTRILIVLELDILEELGECEKIGEPKTLEVKAEDAQPQSTTISSNGFYGNKLEPKHDRPKGQSLPSRTNTPAHGNIFPIEALSPYAHKWTIKARCTGKSEIKTWHNKNGEGKLFTVNLLDESGEIRATCWKEQCDIFHEVFQEGSVYYISSPCRVQLAKKAYSNINNDYELTFEAGTLVEKVGYNDVFHTLLTFAYSKYRRRSRMAFLRCVSTLQTFRICRPWKRMQRST